MSRLKIISGGQTGVDRAAWDAAMACGLPCGGFVPKGRLAEDGVIDPRYPVTEIGTPDYVERTLKNVQAADATLIVARGPLSGGTKMTAEFCVQEGKPFRIVDLAKGTPAEHRKTIRAFIDTQQPAVLNIAGPRESLQPGIYTETFDLLTSAFNGLIPL